jgi:hypothetical protein
LLPLLTLLSLLALLALLTLLAGATTALVRRNLPLIALLP